MGGKNFLVVENQQTQFKKIEENLRKEGYNVFPKESDADCNVEEFVNCVKVWVNEEYPDAYKEAAFEKICDQIERWQIDLILMDHILGGGCKCKTGIDLARAINSKREGAELPVLFMSRTEENEKGRLMAYNRYTTDFPQLSQWRHKGFFGDEILNEDYFSNFVIAAIEELIENREDANNRCALESEDMKSPMTNLLDPTHQERTKDKISIPPIRTDNKSVTSVSKHEPPLVMISYAWEENDHFKKWIETFAKDLRYRGINAQIDLYLDYGADLTRFMGKYISIAKKVLCIITPKYKEKAELSQGGVAYEGSIISHEIYHNQDTTKFIPILCRGSFQDSLPRFLDCRKGFDCSTDKKYRTEIDKIANFLNGIREIEIPPIVR